jgi:hypothetical protein
VLATGDLLLHQQMAQSLQQLIIRNGTVVQLVVIYIPQLIQVLRGQHKLALVLNGGSPLPHHQMAQNLLQLLILAMYTPQLIQVLPGQDKLPLVKEYGRI